jgi:hypothetical protein
MLNKAFAGRLSTAADPHVVNQLFQRLINNLQKDAEPNETLPLSFHRLISCLGIGTEISLAVCG